MNISISIVQVVLAMIFLMAGAMKFIQPKEKLAHSMAWVERYSQSQVRLIGALEVLGALGLVFPLLTGILPWLTPLAAAGLALLMVGAVITHLRLGEYPNIVFPLVLFGLAAFTASGL